MGGTFESLQSARLRLLIVVPICFIAIYALLYMALGSFVSAAIVFLLSPASAFISGSCLRVDGAVPNAKREFAQRGKTAAFDGFHLAATPKVLS